MYDTTERKGNGGHCYSNELRLYQILGLSPNEYVQQKMCLKSPLSFSATALLFLPMQSGRRLHQSRCEKFDPCWRQDPGNQRDSNS